MINNCWICGEIANSQEHKFKASDLRRNYGKKYKGRKALTFFEGDKGSDIESFKSKELLFPPIICIECNNNKTKPHDNSYDIFVKYLDNNYSTIAKSQRIDFEDVYGNYWAEQKLNLYRYFAKHAGCKIISGNRLHNVRDLAEFIKGKSHSSSFKIVFELKEGIYEFMQILSGDNLHYHHLYNSSTTCFFDEQGNDFYAGWQSYKWLSTVWICGEINNSESEFERKIEKVNINFLEDCKSFINLKIEEVIENVEANGLQTVEDLVSKYNSYLSK